MLLGSILLFFTVLPFLLIVVVGAPFVPTKQKDVEEILQYIQLPKNSMIVDLGSGDGRVLVAAAEEGYNTVGYELNLFLYFISIFQTRKYKNSNVVYANYLNANVSNADAVFLFTADPYIKKLQKKLKNELKPGAKVISYGFELYDFSTPKRIASAYIYTL